MSKYIITAIRQQSQLHGSLLLSAIELAHRADGNNGIVTISYSYLASKTHQSRRTAIRHVNRLIDLGIIKCQRFWQAGKKWLCNRYQFVIVWERPKTAQMRSGDNLIPNLPNPQNTIEKYGSLREEKKGRETVLGWLKPDGILARLISGKA
jgi:hypothetical protein